MIGMWDEEVWMGELKKKGEEEWARRGERGGEGGETLKSRSARERAAREPPNLGVLHLEVREGITRRFLRVSTLMLAKTRWCARPVVTSVINVPSGPGQESTRLLWIKACSHDERKSSGLAGKGFIIKIMTRRGDAGFYEKIERREDWVGRDLLNTGLGSGGDLEELQGITWRSKRQDEGKEICESGLILHLSYKRVEQSNEAFFTERIEDFEPFNAEVYNPKVVGGFKMVDQPFCNHQGVLLGTF
ncbi:hypothetical protein BY996DRAFT_6492816 [Phakopsora pachyrhizi]|nr:hypothetical protein BY996DRAFT_6492816 [Phakopsora pachyrhizi]